LARVLVKFFGTIRLDLGKTEVSLDIPQESPLLEILEKLSTELGRETGPKFLEKLLHEGNLRRGSLF